MRRVCAIKTNNNCLPLPFKLVWQDYLLIESLGERKCLKIARSVVEMAKSAHTNMLHVQFAAELADFLIGNKRKPAMRAQVLVEGNNALRIPVHAVAGREANHKPPLFQN